MSRCYFEDCIEKLSKFVPEERMKEYRDKANQYIDAAIGSLYDKKEPHKFLDKILDIYDPSNPEEQEDMVRIFDKFKYNIPKEQLRKVDLKDENLMFDVIRSNDDKDVSLYCKDQDQIERYYQRKRDQGYNSICSSGQIDKIIEYFLEDYLTYYMNDASHISDIIGYIESILKPTMKQDTCTLTFSKVRSCYRRILYKILDSNEDPMKDGYTQFKLLDREQLKTLIDKIKLFDYHAMTSQDVSRFRSLNFLYLTFYLDSDSHYFKEKTLYSRIYALWYICRKGKDIKYLKSHLGKWASLPKLYGYNFNKIISIIKSSEEVQASFDNLDIDF